MYDMTTTIAAISTAAGSAGRAIVRVSGDRATALAETVFRTADTPLVDLGGFRVTPGWVVCEAMTLPARAYVFRAPRSYTRQDVVELHIPGHPLAAGMLLSSLLAAGASPAGPGEFTQRAFLSGRIDLSSAEAVADVISAATDAQLRAATINAGGALRTLCAAWAETVTESLAEVEASIDMAEEDIELLGPIALADRLAALAGEIERALAESVRVTTNADIPRVAMAGAPNVGKSSLLNALTGMDRAIVSATAGTTRDVLTAPLTDPTGREVLLADLAGLTVAAPGVASAADNAARRALASADAVLLVLDSASPDLSLLREVTAAASPAVPITVVANKIDLLTGADAGAVLSRLAEQAHLPVLGCSAVTGAGLDTLTDRLGEAVGVESHRGTGPCALHDRQRDAMARAVAALVVAAEIARPLGHLADAAEFLAVELRTSLAELGTISGEVVTEEVLGRIFARFCVGK